jgi:formate-dependent nitrite reductase membrane component NrfD
MEQLMRKESRDTDMKPYAWMVTYTPQTKWIVRKGLLIWLSLYAGILGGGFYLVSAYFNTLWGMFIGWLIILVIKSGLHVAHAENPLKLWRMILRPQTSWISRGLILTILFIIFGAIQLAVSYWSPGTSGELTLKILTGITAFGVVAYTGFTLNYVSRIPFWNSSLLPVLYILWGFLSGMALFIAINSSDGITRGTVVFNLGLLIGSVILTVLFLWTANYAEATAKESVRELIRGSQAVILWIGVGFLGLIVPIIISLMIYFADNMSIQWLAVTLCTCEIIGGLAFTYCVLKVGRYTPIVTRNG